MITTKLSQANIVILASLFNPSIATKDWLRDHVVKEEPVTFFNSPMVSVFETASLHLLIDQSHFQATCKDVSEKTLNQCADFAQHYVATLPHTPYVAIGFNYVWEVSNPYPHETPIICHDRCSIASPDLTKEFETYDMKPVILGRKGDCLVRINIEPIIEPNKPYTTNVNYHFNYGEASLIAETAKRLIEYSKDSSRLIRTIFKGDS